MEEGIRMGKDIGINEKSIKAVFRKDCMALVIFVVGMWCVILPVLLSVVRLTDDLITKGFLFAAAVVGGVSLTLAIFAVFLHIRKNRDEIYREDLVNQALTGK